MCCDTTFFKHHSQQLAMEVQEKEAILRKLTKQSRTVDKMKRGDWQLIDLFIYLLVHLFAYIFIYFFANTLFYFSIKGFFLCNSSFLALCIYLCVNAEHSIPACYRRVCRDVTEVGNGARTQASC